VGSNQNKKAKNRIEMLCERPIVRKNNGPNCYGPRPNKAEKNNQN
jgi:hypothetical protein